LSSRSSNDFCLFLFFFISFVSLISPQRHYLEKFIFFIFYTSRYLLNVNVVKKNTILRKDPFLPSLITFIFVINVWVAEVNVPNVHSGSLRDGSVFSCMLFKIWTQDPQIQYTLALNDGNMRKLKILGQPIFERFCDSWWVVSNRCRDTLLVTASGWLSLFYLSLAFHPSMTADQ
jgi:hypothetical protein